MRRLYPPSIRVPSLLIRSHRNTAILAFSLMLSSCQVGVDVEVSGSAAAPVFTFSNMGWFGGYEPPIFDRLQVSENSTKGWPAVWQVNRQEGGCRPAASRVVYGRTPSGFVVSAKARPLREGVTYELFINGCGRTGGALFKVVNGHVETVSRNGS